MHSQEKIDEVMGYLFQGKEIKEISLLTGVGKSTIRELKHGRRAPIGKPVHTGCWDMVCEMCGDDVKFGTLCVECGATLRQRSGQTFSQDFPDIEDENDLQLSPGTQRRIDALRWHGVLPERPVDVDEKPKNGDSLWVSEDDISPPQK